MRIILKFGTGILTRPKGDSLDAAQFRELTAEVAALVKAGHECVIVSSGAVGAGLFLFGLNERPQDLPTIQACAAIGQSLLMRQYEKLFSRHGLHIAQLLLTHQDIDSRARYANARNTLERLFTRRHIVPIINQNDSVAVEELRFGDNDRLSAEVAVLANADLLIILTTVEGLLATSDDGTQMVVPVVKDIPAAARLVREERGRFSVGGMTSKLQAAKIAGDAGVRTVIASGKTPSNIARIAAGKNVGTRFEVTRRKRKKSDSV
jgi:glutamate 5-kinase